MRKNSFFLEDGTRTFKHDILIKKIVLVNWRANTWPQACMKFNKRNYLPTTIMINQICQEALFNLNMRMVYTVDCYTDKKNG